MKDGASNLTAPSITARPTIEEKRLFTAIADRRQMSESALALVAIRSLLYSEVPGFAPPDISGNGPAVDRITIRLRPGDRLSIRRRAAGRRMKDSAYIAGLVRGHLAANPPLAAHELVALKQAVAVLAGFGQLLGRTAREAAKVGRLPGDLQQDLSHTRLLIADLEWRMHDFARAALVAWEGRVD